MLLLFFGVSMNASKVVRPLSNILGWPAREIGGAPGILARDNASRNPARTASTASALMIGLALVTFVALFAQGLRAPFEDAVNKLFIGDYAVTSSGSFAPISAGAGKALKGKPGVIVESPIRAGGRPRPQRPGVVERLAAQPNRIANEGAVAVDQVADGGFLEHFSGVVGNMEGHRRANISSL